MSETKKVDCFTAGLQGARPLPSTGRRKHANITRTAGCVLALILGYSGAAQAMPWQNGDLTTYPQGFWDTNAGAVTILANGFLTAYPSSIVEVGIPGTAGFSMRFTDPTAIHAYLPSSGVYAALTGDLINPTTSSSGALGGDVLALELNVDFSDHNLLPATTSFHLGDLLVRGNIDVPAVNGMTVRQIMALANSELGGGTASLAYADLDTIVTDINGAFGAGDVSTFAQNYLIAPETTGEGSNGPPTTVPEPSSVFLVGLGMLGLHWNRRIRRS